MPRSLDLPRLNKLFAAHAGQEYVADAVGLNVVAGSSNRRLGHLSGNNLQTGSQPAVSVQRRVLHAHTTPALRSLANADAYDEGMPTQACLHGSTVAVQQPALAEFRLATM